MDVVTFHNPPDLVKSKTDAIYADMRRQSRRLSEGNFNSIDSSDVARLFRLYDDHFFDGWLHDAIEAKSPAPMNFRLSPTMTRAGGKTILYKRRLLGGQRFPEYEIAIGTRLLFTSFRDVSRPVTVCGHVCADRLEALQRILEHEIVHLLELLNWDKSSCAAARFQGMAQRVFAHTAFKHDLVTPAEHAATQYDIRIGSVVEFLYDGRKVVGRVNRVHHRATVLVESNEGIRYTDGKRYEKFYVPLPRLKPVG